MGCFCSKSDSDDLSTALLNPLAQADPATSVAAEAPPTPSELLAAVKAAAPPEVRLVLDGGLIKLYARDPAAAKRLSRVVAELRPGTRCVVAEVCVVQGRRRGRDGQRAGPRGRRNRRRSGRRDGGRRRAPRFELRVRGRAELVGGTVGRLDEAARQDVGVRAADLRRRSRP